MKAERNHTLPRRNRHVPIADNHILRGDTAHVAIPA
jgi:hypothetical protein